MMTCILWLMMSLVLTAIGLAMNRSSRKNQRTSSTFPAHFWEHLADKR